MTSVRDFIYLDTDRVTSLYSQVFQGVAEQIVHSFVDSVASTDRQKSGFLGGGSVEAQVAEVSRRTESKILHDHIYNRLEARLNPAIVLCNDLSQNNFRDVLQNAFLIKATGPAEIEDYSRMDQIMERFNELGAVIAYSSFNSEEVRQLAAVLNDAVKRTTDSTEKAELRSKLKVLGDVKAFAKEKGLYQNEEVLKGLRLMAHMFRPNGFEISVIPSGLEPALAFRGIVNRECLRFSEDLLRSMYAGTVLSPWTIVGQITYLPGDGRSAAGLDSCNPVEGKSDDPDQPSMREPFRQMFVASRALERMFLEGGSRMEVIVSPLAIYRETAIELSDESK